MSVVPFITDRRILAGNSDPPFPVARTSTNERNAATPGGSARHADRGLLRGVPRAGGVYLDDSWVLEVVPTAAGVSLRLEAVLTPEHRIGVGT